MEEEAWARFFFSFWRFRCPFCVHLKLNFQVLQHFYYNAFLF